MSPPPISPWPLELELPATPSSAAFARRAITAFCSDQVVDDTAVALAVSEAVANAIMHAYRDRDPDQGRVRIFARLEEAALLVVVDDDGSGMRPRTDSPGMGIGLALIARLASGVHIDGDGAGTRVSMRFPRRVTLVSREADGNGDGFESRPE